MRMFAVSTDLSFEDLERLEDEGFDPLDQDVFGRDGGGRHGGGGGRAGGEGGNPLLSATPWSGGSTIPEGGMPLPPRDQGGGWRPWGNVDWGWGRGVSWANPGPWGPGWGWGWAPRFYGPEGYFEGPEMIAIPQEPQPVWGDEPNAPPPERRKKSLGERVKAALRELRGGR